MTWVGVEMTWESEGCVWSRKGRFRRSLNAARPIQVCLVAQGEIPAFAGMTWEGAGMTGSSICCGPVAIHAARGNGTIRLEGMTEGAAVGYNDGNDGCWR